MSERTSSYLNVHKDVLTKGCYSPNLTQKHNRAVCNINKIMQLEHKYKLNCEVAENRNHRVLSKTTSELERHTMHIRVIALR